MERLQYIDGAKGLSIISIVLLHFEEGIFTPQLNLFISAYMITMFYVTAGWVDAVNERKQSFKEFVQRRWKQLMIPYIYWTIILLLFDIVLWCFNYYDSYYIARELYKSITFRGIGTLWFLPALFGGSIIWHYTKYKNKWYVYLGVLILALLYQRLYHDIFDLKSDSLSRIIESPFRVINSMLNAWICISSGYFFSCIIIRFQSVFNKISCLIMGGMLCAVSYWIENGLHVNAIVWTLSAPILSPLGLILIFKTVDDISSFQAILSPLVYCGKHSLAIMVTHYSIVLVICSIVNEYISGEPVLAGTNSLIWFMIAMIVECGLITLLDKNKPYLFGR